VVLRGLLADEEAGGDLFWAQAFSEEAEDFLLAWGQAGVRAAGRHAALWLGDCPPGYAVSPGEFPKLVSLRANNSDTGRDVNIVRVVGIPVGYSTIR
jgi:hypothetical protein